MRNSIRWLKGYLTLSLIGTYLVILGVQGHVFAAPFVDAGGQVLKICPAPEKVFAAIAQNDGSVSLVSWDTNGAKQKDIKVEFDNVSSLHLSLDQNTLLCAGAYKGQPVVRLFDTETLYEKGKLTDVPISSIAMSSRWIACAGDGVQVGLNSDLKLQKLPIAGQGMVAFSPDGGHLLVATTSQITNWSTLNDDRVVFKKDFASPPRSILAVGWDGDYAVVAYSSQGGAYADYYDKSGHHVNGMGTSPASVFALGSNFTFATYDPNKGKIYISHGVKDKVKTIQSFEVTAGAGVKTAGPVNALGFAPDNTLYSASGHLMEMWSAKNHDFPENYK